MIDPSKLAAGAVLRASEETVSLEVGDCFTTRFQVESVLRYLGEALIVDGALEPAKGIRLGGA